MIVLFGFAVRAASNWKAKAASRTRSQCVPRTTPTRWPERGCPRWRRTAGAALLSRSNLEPHIQVRTPLEAYLDQSENVVRIWYMATSLWAKGHSACSETNKWDGDMILLFGYPGKYCLYIIRITFKSRSRFFFFLDTAISARAPYGTRCASHMFFFCFE